MSPTSRRGLNTDALAVRLMSTATQAAVVKAEGRRLRLCRRAPRISHRGGVEEQRGEDVRDRAGGPFGEGGDDVEQGRRQINDQGEDDQDEMGDLRAAPPWCRPGRPRGAVGRRGSPVRRRWAGGGRRRDAVGRVGGVR